MRSCKFDWEFSSCVCLQNAHTIVRKSTHIVRISCKQQRNERLKQKHTIDSKQKKRKKLERKNKMFWIEFNWSNTLPYDRFMVAWMLCLLNAWGLQYVAGLLLFFYCCCSYFVYGVGTTFHRYVLVSNGTLELTYGWTSHNFSLVCSRLLWTTDLFHFQFSLSLYTVLCELRIFVFCDFVFVLQTEKRKKENSSTSGFYVFEVKKKM